MNPSGAGEGSGGGAGEGAEQSVEEAVLVAHEAFYAAVETGDLDALRHAWVDDPASVCVHPGASPIHGTDAVLRSWALIMANTAYLQFFLTDVQVTVTGDLAAVTLTENVLTAQEGQPTDSFHGGRARAVNVLVRTAGGWRMWLHQAAPVGSDDI